MRIRRFGVAAAVVFVTAPLGCQEEIRRYEVAKPEPIVEASAAGKVPVRMLVAMAPHGERTWFFKLMGPVETVDQQRKAFDEFLQSVRFTTEPAKPVEWKVPEGWRAESDAGKANAMVQRYATFHMGPADHSAELTVTPLGRSVGSLLANVNRWRGQIGLKPLAPAELTEVSKSLKVDNEAATFIDMSGLGTLKPPSPHPPPRRGEGQAGGQLASRPPSRPAAPAGPLKYTAPAAWQELPTSGMRVASFAVTEGSAKADVSVIPLGGASGSMLDNVNRWRDEVQLPPMAASDLARQVREITVAGANAYYVEMTGTSKARSVPQTTLAVGIPRGPQTWFIKMWGPPELVQRQKGAFEAFVRSLEFAAGANRG